jgi:hypothetical protein
MGRGGVTVPAFLWFANNEKSMVVMIAKGVAGRRFNRIPDWLYPETP